MRQYLANRKDYKALIAACKKNKRAQIQYFFADTVGGDKCIDRQMPSKLPVCRCSRHETAHFTRKGRL